MITVENLRRRIGQEFENECHLTADEARRIFDVYEAACAWRDEVTGGMLTREDAAADRLITAVDAARIP
jgi:hypothetical protein